MIEKSPHRQRVGVDPAAGSQLVEVINEDYADFVSLSTKLVNVDGAVLRMQKPLLELRVSQRTCRTARSASC